MATMLDFASFPKQDYPAGIEQIFGLAGKMSQDGDFVLARRFDRLSLFSILCLQQRLFFLEAKLERLEADHEVMDYPERDKLVADVQQTVKNFNKAVLAQSAICNMSSPPPRVRENVLTLMNKKYQSVQREFGSLTAEDNNLITFTRNSKPWLHRLIDSTPWLRRFYRMPNQRNPGEVELWSEEKISRHLARAVIILFSAVAFGTFFALSYVHERETRGSIIVASTGLVVVLVELFMDLRSHEVLIIIIGYTAILVNIPSGSK